MFRLNVKHIALVIFILLIFALTYLNKESMFPENRIVSNSTRITCDRDKRLENPPAFDRALSLIYEKYLGWAETEGNYGTYFFFPPSLVNCIKVVETDVRNETQAEGYFLIDSDKIGSNYYPIYVDTSYESEDIQITALLLVHEITHVWQYVREDNNIVDISCIDSETEAFDALYSFYLRQYGTAKEGLELRLDSESELHPQIATLKRINDEFPSIIGSISDICDDDDCSEEITENRRKYIKNAIEYTYTDTCAINAE